MEYDTGAADGERDVIASGPPERSGGRRTATIVSAAALLVAAGGAAAWAAGNSSDSGGTVSGTAVSPAYGAAAPDSEGFLRVPRGGGFEGGRGALHGELTVPDGTAYKQVLMQRGDVTAVSATSLTVASADGYSRTYVLTKDTKVDGKAGDVSTLAKGDKVFVLADLAGSAATATRVHEQGAAPAAGEGPFGPGRHGGHGGAWQDATPDAAPDAAPDTAPGATPGAAPSSSPGAAPEGSSADVQVAPDNGRTA